MSIITDISLAQEALLAGKLVGIPTETVYGLAGNGLAPETVAAIFSAKNRPHFDPLILHGHSKAQLFALATHVPAAADTLADAFWPGPLTLLLPTSTAVPALVTADSPYVGLRIPNHRLTLSLLQQLPFPLAAPSANPFGYVSPTTAQHVEAQLGDAVAYILDGGPCTVGVESTIVGFDAQGKTLVYRKGGISLEQLRAQVGAVRLAEKSPLPVSPGMLASHYAPRIALQLGDIPTLLAQCATPEQVAILSFRHSYRKPLPQDIVLSPNGDLTLAAQRLFSTLRTLDAHPGISLILAEPVPEEGLGLAINDRLERAAAPRPTQP